MDNDKLIEAMARRIAVTEACHPDDWRHFIEPAQAALRARDEWMRANGMVMVPVEPSESMVDAGDEVIIENSALGICRCAEDVYRAMIAAAQEEG